MAGKVKMKCPRCGKHFRSGQAKQTLCPECEARERRARAASKAAGPQTAQPSPTATVAPKIVGPGASILVSVPGARVSGAVTAPAAQTPTPGSIHAADQPKTPGREHSPAPDGPNATSARPSKSSSAGQRQPATKAPREPRPQTPPFELTDELRARIEARYFELAQPVEFDGIRTQIAQELAIPKHAVKRAVYELRTRMQLPSWWDLRAYTGSDEDLLRIQAAYEPLLPVPPIGIHKQIAVDLGLEPAVVYQGIRRVRAERHLPQYNPPELHESGPVEETASSPDAEPPVVPQTPGAPSPAS